MSGTHWAELEEADGQTVCDTSGILDFCRGQTPTSGKAMSQARQTNRISSTTHAPWGPNPEAHGQGSHGDTDWNAWVEG